MFSHFVKNIMNFIMIFNSFKNVKLFLVALTLNTYDRNFVAYVLYY